MLSGLRRPTANIRSITLLVLRWFSQKSMLNGGMSTLRILPRFIIIVVVFLSTKMVINYPLPLGQVPGLYGEKKNDINQEKL